MRSVDTNVLVRLITRDHPQQAMAADAFIDQGAWVSLLALTETTWVLSAVYDRGAVEIAICVEMLLKHRSLTIQEADVVIAALDLFREKPSLGFSDCLLLQLSNKAGHLPLGTFDRALARVAGTKKL